MDAGEKAPWLNYLEGDIIGKETQMGERVYQLVIRVTGGGLQGILKARKHDDYVVCFVGAGTYSSLASRARKAIEEPGAMWRKDKYAPI